LRQQTSQGIKSFGIQSYAFDYAELQRQESLDAVKAAGVQVSYPDKSSFVEKSKSVADKYGKDPLIKPLIEKIRNIQ